MPYTPTELKMFITLCNKFERDVDRRMTGPIKQKLTKSWFNAMLHQVETARHEILAKKFYGYQPNGRIFPAFDIHRHGLAAAYLLNKQSRGSMFTNPDQPNKYTSSDKLNGSVKSVTGGMSNITIINQDHWKPITRPKLEKKPPQDVKSYDLDKMKSLSCTPPVISRSRLEERIKFTVPDKLEEQKATAEMELSAKSCIESCAEFKLLFVPGYELECAEQYYEDPFSSGSAGRKMGRSSEVTDDPFQSRFLALGKLEDETMSNEDRQKRYETMICVSRYTGAYKERKLTNDRRSQSSSSAQLEESPTERTAAIKSRPVLRTSGRKSAVTVGQKTFNIVADKFDSARNSSQNLISECNELNFGYDMTSSEDTDSLQGSESKTKSACEQTKKPIRNGKIKKKKCSSSSDLKPSRFYDINKIAATYAMPCEEKMKDGNRMRNRNSAPGKSYFSQRKNSLTTKPAPGRPATAVERMKKYSTQKRPNTAIVDTRLKNKEVGDQ